MRYDVMGNKIETDSSTAGVWTYSYDPLGELISQTGPNGFTTTQSYDKLGRMTRRVQPNVAQGGSITTHWIYDKAAHGIGKLAEESKSTGFDRDYTYTAYAQLLTRS
jgi:YD repeat-containing protein